MEVQTDPRVVSVFENYPETVKKEMETLRSLILETAHEIEGVTQLEETLKWGEPSYLTKHGSTLRIDWKAKNPSQYAMYFQCTSKLIPAFRMIYQNTFTFEGSRAIVFKLNATLPTKELKQCIGAALQYHKLKHLPTLGL